MLAIASLRHATARGIRATAGARALLLGPAWPLGASVSSSTNIISTDSSPPLLPLHTRLGPINEGITMAWVRDMTDILAKDVASTTKLDRSRSHSANVKTSSPPLPRELVLTVLHRALHQMRALPTLLDLTIAPGTALNICGDTHGQFFDLLHILSPPVASWPSTSNAFLFNGDFVDRGAYSFEVIFTLLALKLANPQAVHLLRGNHETTDMNAAYGFERQILDKYDWEVLEAFRDVFAAMPVAAVVEKKVFVVHGGLGPESSSMSLDDIRRLGSWRKATARGSGSSSEHLPDCIAELLWGDPVELSAQVPMHQQLGFIPNTRRGGGWMFGPDVTAAFLVKNNLRLLVRSHEARQEGFTVDHEIVYPLTPAAPLHGSDVQNEDEDAPLSSNDYLRCLTVFSAPNYCDAQGNLGAFVRISRGAAEGEVGDDGGDGDTASSSSSGSSSSNSSSSSVVFAGRDNEGANAALRWQGVLEPPLAGPGSGSGSHHPLSYRVMQFPARPHPRSSSMALRVLARQQELWQHRLRGVGVGANTKLRRGAADSRREPQYSE